MSLSRTLLLLPALAVVAVACGGDRAQSEPPAADTPPLAEAPASETAPFSLDSIPLSQARLPDFPFIDWPPGLPDDQRTPETERPADRRTVIAGAQLLDVSGRLEQRVHSIPASSSAADQRGYYRERITALGGITVNRLQPVNDAAMVTEPVRALFGDGEDPAKRLDLQRYDEGDYTYEVSVLRTARETVWWIVQVSTYSVIVTTIATSDDG